MNLRQEVSACEVLNTEFFQLFALTWLVQSINEPELLSRELRGAGQTSGCDQAVQELGH